LIQELQKSGKGLEIIWHFKKGVDVMLKKGEEFQEVLGVKMEFVEDW
jgi:hypothetical protein